MTRTQRSELAKQAWERRRARLAKAVVETVNNADTVSQTAQVKTLTTGYSNALAQLDSVKLNLAEYQRLYNQKIVECNTLRDLLVEIYRDKR